MCVCGGGVPLERDAGIGLMNVSSDGVRRGNLTRVSGAPPSQLNRRRRGVESVNEHKWAGVNSRQSGAGERQGCFCIIVFIFLVL